MNRAETAAALRSLFTTFEDCTDEELALIKTAVTVVISRRKQKVLTP